MLTDCSVKCLGARTSRVSADAEHRALCQRASQLSQNWCHPYFIRGEEENLGLNASEAKRRISGVWYARRRKTEREEKKRREKRTSS